MWGDEMSSGHRAQTSFEPAALEVDLTAIGHNVRAVRRQVGAHRRLFAALKANAYGFGLVPVARELERSGVDAISVARMQDAIEVRRAGVDIPILLYAGAVASPDLVHAVEQFRVTPTLLDARSAQTYSDHLREEVPVFVKVDVGLRRLGVEPDQLPALATAIATLPRLRLEGVYTHLHVPSDPVPESYLEVQFDRFCHAVAEVENRGIRVPVTMAASSAVLRHTGAMGLDAVDPGRLYFGLVPGVAGAGFDVRSPLRALRTRLLAVKELSLPAPPAFPWARPGMRLGVAALGAADGLATACGSHVLVRGRRVPVLGPPSLEHFRVDLESCPAEPGDDVVVIGRQGDEEITVDEVAAHCGVDLTAMVPIGIRASIPRRYVS